MADALEFWLPGYTQKGGREVATMGKARPRFSLRFLSLSKVAALLSDPEALKRYLNKCVRAHMPRDYAKEVERLKGMAAWHRPREPATQPVAVVLRFYFGRPKSRTVELGTPYLGPPDLDNLEGTVLDSLTGMFWADDRLVWKLESAKVYGKHAGTAVKIHTLPSVQPGLFGEQAT